jgi:hypothetical protein
MPEAKNYKRTEQDFISAVRTKFTSLNGEVTQRNQDIGRRDSFIYGDMLRRSLNIPIGHDVTSVNWVRRTVEVHKNMFMGRGFQLISTYNTENLQNIDDPQQKKQVEIENNKRKEFAEQRKRFIDSIIEDNGGNSLWLDAAENASAVGFTVMKAYWDKEDKKYCISIVESVENIYALWNKDNFRSIDAVAFVYQVSKQEAIEEYGATKDVATSPLGRPLEQMVTNTNYEQFTNQPMVTILEISGKLEGWTSENGKIKPCMIGKEAELNALVVGDKITRLIDKEAEVPKFYILPNKKYRKRAWGVSDISDAAISLNQTYIETLSDWRTVAAKVNFPKYKAYGFGKDTQMPRPESRKVQLIPLADGQDISELAQSDANRIDFSKQLEELKEQFVRETGVSRVLFDDPSVTLNSNQALITSMKPTSDIAEAKKNMWGPILIKMFKDALDTIGQHIPAVKDINDSDKDWTLKVMWPSLMQKEDPIFQQMLLNRKNAGVISVQSYLEAQGESKEELDRIREEMSDPLTAAIHGNQLQLLAQQLIAPPSNEPQVKTSVTLRGDLTPGQEANLATQQGFNDGPFPPSMGPQGNQGMAAQENADNAQFLTGNAFKGGQPIVRGPDGQPLPGNGMQQQGKGQVTTPVQNQEGQGVASQPGSGATSTTAQGAINQATQNQGG